MTITDAQPAGGVESERLEAILAGCEGAQGGPWKLDKFAVYVWAPSEKGGDFPVMDDPGKSGRVVEMRGWGYYTGHGHGALGLDPDEARRRIRLTGEHVARLDPQTVASIITELLAYRRRPPADAGKADSREAKRLRDNLEEIERTALSAYGDCQQIARLASAAIARLDALPAAKAWLDLSCDDQFALATRIAANVGYVLKPDQDFALLDDPEPDTPTPPVPVSEDAVEAAADALQRAFEAGGPDVPYDVAARHALAAALPHMARGDQGAGPVPLTIIYTNWRGETAERTITPVRLWYGSTEWHPEPQWLLKAIDAEKGAERDFAWAGIDFQGNGPALPHMARGDQGAGMVRLPPAFITCVSDAPNYRVEIKTKTLADAQAWHNTVLATHFAATPTDQVTALVEALRDCHCPRPVNGKPYWTTIGECIDCGECGCLHKGLTAKAPAPDDTKGGV